MRAVGGSNRIGCSAHGGDGFRSSQAALLPDVPRWGGGEYEEYYPYSADAWQAPELMYRQRHAAQALPAGWSVTLSSSTGSSEK